MTVLALLAALALTPALAQRAPLATPSRVTPYITEEMDYWLMKGVEDIYRMRFDEAEAAANKAVELNPAHPHAYMGLAGVAWTRYVYGTDQGDPALMDVFAERTKKAVS